MGYTKAIACFFFVMAFFGATMAAEYTVGDAGGWTIGVDYQKWASNHTFRSGDTLRFVFDEKYNVIRVRKEEYEQCKPGLLDVFVINSPYRIWLPKSGDYYFISATPLFACEDGMQLQIRVLPSSSPVALAPTKPRTSSDGAPTVAALSVSTFITFGLVVFLALAY